MSFDILILCSTCTVLKFDVEPTLRGNLIGAVSAAKKLQKSDRGERQTPTGEGGGFSWKLDGRTSETMRVNVRQRTHSETGHGAPERQRRCDANGGRPRSRPVRIKSFNCGGGRRRGASPVTEKRMRPPDSFTTARKRFSQGRAAAQRSLVGWAAVDGTDEPTAMMKNGDVRRCRPREMDRYGGPARFTRRALDAGDAVTYFWTIAERETRPTFTSASNIVPVAASAIESHNMEVRLDSLDADYETMTSSQVRSHSAIVKPARSRPMPPVSADQFFMEG